MGFGAVFKGLAKIAGIAGKTVDDAAAAADKVTDVARIVNTDRPLKALGVADDVVQGSAFLKHVDETPGVFKIIYENAEKLGKLSDRANAFLLKNVDLLGSILKSNATALSNKFFDVLDKMPKFKKLAKENPENIDDLAKTVDRNPNTPVDSLARDLDNAPGIVNGAGRLSPNADDALKFGDDFKSAIRRLEPYNQLDTAFIDRIEISVKKLPPLESAKIKGIIKKLQDGKVGADGKILGEVDEKALVDFIEKVDPGWGQRLRNLPKGAWDAVAQKTWKELIIWGAILGMGMYFIIKMVSKAQYNGTITEIKYDAKTWGEGVFVNHTPGIDINRKDEIVVSESKVAGVDGTHTARQVIGPSQYVLSTKPPSPWPGDCTSSPCGKLFVRPNFFATLGETVGDAAAGVATAAGEVAKGLFDGLLEGLGLGGMGWIKWVCLALIILSSAMLTIGIAMKFS